MNSVTVEESWGSNYMIVVVQVLGPPGYSEDILRLLIFCLLNHVVHSILQNG